MGALLYIYKTSMKNRIKIALKKPVTYVYLVLIAVYAVFIIGSLFSFSGEVQLESHEILALILSTLVLITVPSNIITYAKKKGLLFKPSDAHFVFTAPISPKKILFYTYVKTLAISTLMMILVSVAAYVLVNISLGRILLYFIFSCLVQPLYETSMMILIYGNERFSEKTMNLISKGMWLLVILTVGFIVYMAATQGVSIATFSTIMFSPVLQAIPIIGWNIAIIQLIILGPTTVNVICTVLYIVMLVLFAYLAKAMRCTGAYYEDAAKFADDYQEMKKKSQKGEVSQMGKRKKYGKATVVYKGNYAKAIFYRQLLEYKKNRFFIFNMMTLVCLACGIGVTVMGYMRAIEREYGVFIILGLAAYMCFVLSAFATKWTKEMENPYTYLIPDKPVRKLWYATVIDHIRSIIDGCLLTIAPAIFFRIGIIQTILIILVYVCIQANKLYISVLAEALLGNILGVTGKQVTRMLFQGAVYGIGAVLAAVGVVAFGFETGFLILVLYSIVITAVILVLASSLFTRMESIS